MQLRYALDERPPLAALLLYGLQWLAIIVPSLVIIGKVVATLHSGDPAGQTLYLQRLAFATAITLLVQLFWGHRLPLIAGPATVLLIGILASRAFSPAAIYTAIAAGGLLLALLSLSGLFGYLQRLFTPRVVAVVLLLIAFALMPTIRNLVASPSPGVKAPANLGFALVLILVLFLAQTRLPARARSTLIVWGMLLGSGAYYLYFTVPSPLQAPLGAAPLAGFFTGAYPGFSLQPGVLIAFLFCYLALSINDLGSIQALVPLLDPADMPGRITRGMTVTGLANLLAGLLGVIGPVDYSLSPGVIAATGCAARLTLVPTALALLLLSFSPMALGLLGAVPPAVIGAVLFFILSSQVAAGLLTACGGKEAFRFEHGLIIGLPLLLGTLVAFLPPPVVAAWPLGLRPILGNGFVVGVLSALLLEHALIRL